VVDVYDDINDPDSATRSRRSSSAGSPRFCSSKSKGGYAASYRTPLKLQFLTEYYNFFLQTNIRIALNTKDESHTLAANVLIRRLLCELSAHSHTYAGYSPGTGAAGGNGVNDAHACSDGRRELLKLTSAYLCFHYLAGNNSAQTSAMSLLTNQSTHSNNSSSAHGGANAVSSSSSGGHMSLQPGTQTMSMSMITRALSVSKMLTSSSMQVIHDLLYVCPLQHAVVFITKLSEQPQYQAAAMAQPSPAQPATPTKSSAVPLFTSPGYLPALIAGDPKKSMNSTPAAAITPTHAQIPTTSAHTNYLSLCAAIASINTPALISQSQEFQATPCTPGIHPAKSQKSIDTRMAHICAVLANAQKHPQDDPTIEKSGKGLGLDAQHGHLATDAILVRIADKYVYESNSLWKAFVHFGYVQVSVPQHRSRQLTVAEHRYSGLIRPFNTDERSSDGSEC
jgi:hypothetical protein